MAASLAPVSLWPLGVLGLCVGLVVVQITVVRLHAFLALIIAAIAAGILSRVGSLPGEVVQGHFVQAVELTTAELGATAGRIGVVIALAAVIGACLSESGAADKIVRRFLALFGPRRAGLALLSSSYVISIPVFFDTFFMLLLPIARALAFRTGQGYVFFVMAIASAGAVTHGLVTPHPGPLAMAEILKIDVGVSVLAGLAIGVVPVLAGWPFLRWLDRRTPVAVRPAPGSSHQDLSRAASRPESELPSFVAAIAPIVVPVLLIGLATTVAALPAFRATYPTLAAAAAFAGNRNVALLASAAIALLVLARHRRTSVRNAMIAVAPALEAAGVIILITSAGGAFGLMLKHAGVGDTIRALAQGRAMNLILLGWLLAAVLRVAQGSATVALLTTAAMLQPLIAAAPLPYHPVYVFLAIGFGGMIFSWANDSGFWVVGRLSGFSERETLRTWSLVVTFNSVVGLVAVFVASKLLPLR